jgi:hypothetical protein
MTAQEIRIWLNTLDDDERVAIDEGGLTLLAEGGDYLEVGGEPEGGWQ